MAAMAGMAIPFVLGRDRAPEPTSDLIIAGQENALK
jgi:hypothetical protein